MAGFHAQSGRDSAIVKKQLVKEISAQSQDVVAGVYTAATTLGKRLQSEAVIPLVAPVLIEQETAPGT